MPLIGHTITNAINYYSCLSYSDIIIERAFLSKYQAVMKINATWMGIGFVENIGPKLYIFWVIVDLQGMIIISLVLTAVVLKICKRSVSDDKEPDKYW